MSRGVLHPLGVVRPWRTPNRCLNRSYHYRPSLSRPRLLWKQRQGGRNTRWAVRARSPLPAVAPAGAGMPIPMGSMQVRRYSAGGVWLRLIVGYKREERPYRAVQYQRPGVQVQVTHGQQRYPPYHQQQQGRVSYPYYYHYSHPFCSYFPYTPCYCSPLTFVAYAHPTDSRIFEQSQAQGPPPPYMTSGQLQQPIQPGMFVYSLKADPSPARCSRACESRERLLSLVDRRYSFIGNIRLCFLDVQALRPKKQICIVYHRHSPRTWWSSCLPPGTTPPH